MRSPHGGGPGGGEHEGLAVGARLAGNRADVRLKAQVEHAVGFIQDKKADFVQPGRNSVQGGYVSESQEGVAQSSMRSA